MKYPRERQEGSSDGQRENVPPGPRGRDRAGPGPGGGGQDDEEDEGPQDAIRDDLDGRDVAQQVEVEGKQAPETVGEEPEEDSDTGL
jgi:hypothetical protein